MFKCTDLCMCCFDLFVEKKIVLEMYSKKIRRYLVDFFVVGKLADFFSQRTTCSVITFHSKQKIIQRNLESFSGEDEVP